MSNKNPTLKFFESEHGQQLIEVAKSFTEGMKRLESLFKEILPNTGEEQVTAEVVVKKGKKRVRDPNAPKHPLSSYLLFARDNRPSLKESRPELTPTEIAVELGKMWRELSSEQKDVYVAEAEQLREQYNIESSAYTKSKSEASITALPAGDDSSEDETEEAPETKKAKTVIAEVKEVVESSEESESEPDSPVLASVPEPVAPKPMQEPKKKKKVMNKENIAKPAQNSVLPTPSEPEKKKKKKSGNVSGSKPKSASASATL